MDNRKQSSAERDQKRLIEAANRFGGYGPGLIVRKNHKPHTVGLFKEVDLEAWRLTGRNSDRVPVTLLQDESQHITTQANPEHWSAIGWLEGEEVTS